MSIPKIIHYCWFGGSELPELAKYCIASWKKQCPDYQIIRWDENTSDLESCLFVKEAYREGKWAFVSDYIRLKVINEFGGVYLDIDVELLRPLNDFLDFDGFMGFEEDKVYNVNTGLGFGAVKEHPVINGLIEHYEKIQFIKGDGQLDMTPCPFRDTVILKEFGLIKNNKKQCIYGIHILPTDYFCPRSALGKEKFTINTVAIHHYFGSWLSERKKTQIKRKKRIISIWGFKLGYVVNYVCVGFDEFIEFGGLALLKRATTFLRK